MKAEMEVRTTSGPDQAARKSLQFFSRALRLFSERLREAQFWQVQALVLFATVPHYAIESSGEAFPTLESWQLNSLAISLYIVPLLVAALNYSWEGAVLTALWAAALTSPSLWYWDRSGTHWATEMGQLLVVLPVGLLVAWRVSLEAVLRRRAETTTERLALLNKVGEALSRTLEVEQQLPGVLRRLLTGLSLQAAWLYLEPASESTSSTVLVEISNPKVPPPVERAKNLHARVASAEETVVADGQTAVIPLMGEGGLLGSLGAMVAETETLADEQMELLATVAHEVRVAVENAWLYRERQESLQSYVRQVTQAQEEERLRISRELHDETAQELVFLVRRLEAVGQDAAPATAAHIDELLRMARDTLRSVRRFSRDLRPAVLDDLGLVAAIEMVVEETSGRLSKGAQLKVLGEPRRVDRTIELALFRIAQEALRNVEKHSHATSATVKLAFEDDEVQLSVSDNGQGFSPPRNLSQLASRGSLGLLGMKERADLVGGQFELRSSPGHGSELTVTVEAT